MIKLFKICTLASLISCLFVSNVFAAGGWTGWQKAWIVYTQNNGRIYIQLKDWKNTHVNPDACSSPGYYLMPKSDGSGNSLKLLLTAKASNLNVRLYVNGCTGSNPTAHHVQIY